MSTRLNSFNKILTNHSYDLSPEEIDVIRETLYPIISAGYSDYSYWRPSVDANGRMSWTLSKSVSTPDEYVVRGQDGDPGADGVNGRTPVISIDPENSHFLWKYEDATSGWTDTGMITSGSQGPEGERGEAGRTPTFRVRETDSMFQWEYVGEGEQGWKNLDLITSGNNGTDGFSPTVSAEVIPTSVDSRGGYKLTFQYGPEGGQTESINIYNGTNGEGASFTVSEGTGIDVVRTGDNFNVALDTDTQTALAKVPVLAAASAGWNDVSAKLDKTIWDSTSGDFITMEGVEAGKQYVMKSTGWAELEEGMYQVEVDNTYLSGDGTTNNAIGIKKSFTDAWDSAKEIANAYVNASGDFVKKPASTIAGAYYGWRDNSWVQLQSELPITPDTTFFSGNGTFQNALGLKKTYTDHWEEAYNVALAYKTASSDFLKTVSTDGTTISGNGATTQIGLDGLIADEIHAAIKYVHCNSAQHAFSGIGASGAGNLFGIDETGMAATKQYGWDYDTHAWTEIQSGGDYLPLSGGTVTGRTNFSAATGQNILAVASAASLVGASRQSEANFGQNNTAMGTTWMGVGGPGMYRGFLKYTQGGNVGDLNSNNEMQVEFTPTNKGQLFARAKNNGNDCPETQILNPTKSSCDAMTTSGNANLVSGPNYLIAKNADGQFTIGAGFVNCTDMNNVTLTPNTYYFVYEV
jgi:hypothetical protein